MIVTPFSRDVLLHSLANKLISTHLFDDGTKVDKLGAALPRLSYISDDWAKTDPAFWKPKVAAPTTKPAAKPEAKPAQ